MSDRQKDAIWNVFIQKMQGFTERITLHFKVLLDIYTNNSSNVYNQCTCVHDKLIINQICQWFIV